MQLHAFDRLGKIVSAQWAQRQTNYLCLECRQKVRVRKGLHRQPHFYHTEPVQYCRQHQKSLVHLTLQLYFFRHLPPGDCQLEVPFPSIARIADVAWLSKKIIFEIQCSPISAEEALSRNQDYQKEGWNVIWIFHDQRFNQERLSAVEMALRSSPHYFSNMDHTGKGVIYDQFDWCNQGLRHARLPPLPLDIKMGMHEMPKMINFPLRLLEFRAKNWPFFFSGDLMSQFKHQEKPFSDYLKQAITKEREIAALFQVNLHSLLIKAWRVSVVHPYRVVFHYLLERFCR